MAIDAKRSMVFSKHIAAAGPVAEVCSAIGARLHRIGVGAVDLTVRPKGHVDSERAEDDLPAAQSALATHGVRIGMLTTGITEADAASERILRTAARLGIRTYKLGYFMYRGFGSLRDQRREVAARLKDIAAMNRALGVHGGFHNHSDDYFGANLADADSALDGIDRSDIGIYLDPCHAVIEGGSQGWLMALDLVAQRVSMLAVKDFHWVPGKGGYAGGRANSVQFCPLADGNTPWPAVLSVLARVHFDGPVSFHSEYQGSASFRDLDFDQVADQTAADISLFTGWLRAAQGTER
ncbi:MAG: sugar phosphate isomerase/epimerase [Planctomycetes bacterium]|nr:sugar phosphate isomerase/epimerase [Planctomycetota bacterium]